MAGRELLWVDAAEFTQTGGWRLDAQFVHLMGSAYLLAAGANGPVGDATTTVCLPRAGRYRVWARCKDWLPEYSPGRFRVGIGPRQAAPDAAAGNPGKILGMAGTDDWLWECAGDFDLPAGETTVALKDETGYFGRCAALLLTTDPEYTPPNDLEGMRLERARIKGLPTEARAIGAWDVVVVGAGAAGCCAALACARLGARAALLDNRTALGGNSSSELGVPINGAASFHPNARESGIIEEIGRMRARFSHAKTSDPFLIAMQAEPRLDLFLGRQVTRVELAGPDRIAAVEAVDVRQGTLSRYEAALFIDCTGDGWVGYHAGAEVRQGREGRGEFGESLAPEQPDGICMSGALMGPGWSFIYEAEETGAPAPYSPPPWAYRFPDADQFGRKIDWFHFGNWWMEHRGELVELEDQEKARDDLLRITFGCWDYVKNVWPDREKAASYALAFVCTHLAKRETRRFVGDYTLTQQDVESGRVFPDRIGYGGWMIDIHHPRGIFSGSEGPFQSSRRAPIYTIPFRCLYSRNVTNLLFAGRNISVTHVALGSVRVQGTLATLGQAAGTAAALCVSRSLTPRELGERHIGCLQQTLLKHDQHLPELANEDPGDLARHACVAASSTTGRGGFAPANVTNGVARPVGDAPNLWASDPEEPLPQWIELRFDVPTEVSTVFLTFDTDLNRAIHDAGKLRAVPPFVPEECVRDYELSGFNGERWIALAAEAGNYQRRRAHRFDTAALTALRLTVTATNGSRSARVFEIRAYQE